MNIQFEYLYRDAGNFKNWGNIIFSNPSDTSLEALTRYAREMFIDQSYFIARNVKVPDLHFSSFDSDLDHDWHEFHGFVETRELPNDKKDRSVDEFLRDIRLAHS